MTQNLFKSEEQIRKEVNDLVKQATKEDRKKDIEGMIKIIVFVSFIIGLAILINFAERW